MERLYLRAMSTRTRTARGDRLEVPADSDRPGWLGALPQAWVPYALLARLDRPTGVWLLFIPCLIGLAFQRLHSGLYLIDLWWAFLFLVGAVAMRGAGCTWNDITDRRYDARVARTALRPIPSGAVTVRQASLFLLGQLGAGFLVWLLLPGDAKLAALLALPMVLIYPFTKRVTWWPQAWLGLTFNWGVFVGAATASEITGPVYLIYFGLVLWTIAYDTIYALQDRDDDALIGVRSTARLFGKHAVMAAFCFHAGAAALVALACAANGAGKLGALTALAFLAHGAWQAVRLKGAGDSAALKVFKSNVTAGAIVAGGLTLAAIIPDAKPRTLFAGPEIVPLSEPRAVPLPFGFELRRKSPPVPEPDLWFASDAERVLRARGLIEDATSEENQP